MHLSGFLLPRLDMQIEIIFSVRCSTSFVAYFWAAIKSRFFQRCFVVSFQLQNNSRRNVSTKHVIEQVNFGILTNTFHSEEWIQLFLTNQELNVLKLKLHWLFSIDLQTILSILLADTVVLCMGSPDCIDDIFRPKEKKRKEKEI